MSGEGVFGREANQIIHDDPDRPANAIPGEPAEVESLRRHPLSGERGVAVKRDAEYSPAPRPGPASPSLFPRSPDPRLQGGLGLLLR